MNKDGKRETKVYTNTKPERVKKPKQRTKTKETYWMFKNWRNMNSA